MTDRTQPDSASTKGAAHIIRYALELGLLWIDGDGRDKVREALDALDTLEAQLEAIGAGGVQALSAAPAEADMFWDAEDGERFGHDIDDIISDFGPGDRVKIDCAKRMPSIEVLVVADGDDLSYQAVSPTPSAEQQTPADAQLCKFYGVSTDAELIAAQARHIEKLQAKLPPTPSFAPQRVREG